MKIKEGFVIREVAGKYMVIATGEASKSFKGMVTLNKTGKDIWQGIENGFTEKEIACQLSELYSVTVEDALKDVKEMIESMAKAGFFTE